MVEVFENWSLMLVEYIDKVWTTNVRLKQKEFFLNEDKIKIQMLEMFKIQLEYNKKKDEIGWWIWTNLIWCKLLIDSLTS
jgi:hypothetical protein